MARQQGRSWTDILKDIFHFRVSKSRLFPLRVEELESRFCPAVFNPLTATADGDAGSLRDAITIANTNGDALNTFTLEAGTYNLSIVNAAGQENANAQGDLDLDNLNGGVATKTYTFVGAGAGVTFIDANDIDRVFHILGADVIVNFQDLTIIDGTAIDNGATGATIGQTDAKGGGILNEGGDLSFTSAAVASNLAAGFNGNNGANGAGSEGGLGDDGNGGVDGRNAMGGGLYSTGGTISIDGSTFSLNVAQGGDGGDGGDGANAGTIAPGNGGDGGDGGDAQGGGIFLQGGIVTIDNSSNVSSNSADAGSGGSGGLGGDATVPTGGAGGNGGLGGHAQGGGIFVLTGDVIVDNSSNVTSNQANAGAGGNADAGGTGTNQGGAAGIGGAGGLAQGGGIWVQVGDVTIANASSVESNLASAGTGGNGGAGGFATGAIGAGGHGGHGGDGGLAQGGGVWVQSGDILIDLSDINENSAVGGNGGNAGDGGGGTIGGTTGGNGGNGGNGGSVAGAGIFLNSGSLTLDAATVDGNDATAANGGNGANGGNATTSAGDGGNGGNGGDVQGAGLFTGAGAVTVDISDSLIANNSGSAGDGGGNGLPGTGIVAGVPGTAGDGGDILGGGLHIGGGTATISNSTISNNLATLGGSAGPVSGGGTAGSDGVLQGGGLYIGVTLGVDIHNSTVADNAAAGEGGGIRNLSTLNLVSTLIGDNNSLATTEEDLSNAGALTASRSLIESPNGHTIIDGSNFNIVGLDPNLDVLADNGGPTLTHALLFGSPAIDAGENVDVLAFDQREAGFPRKLGVRTDIGAFEFGDPAGTPIIVAGADAGGGPHVKVYDSTTGAVLFSFFAYDASFQGGVRVAAGDVNGDGVFDIITGAGPGGGPHVKVFDGLTGAEIDSFFAFDIAFTGGVFVAAGDVNDDGFADIITGAGAGGGPHVKVFSGADGSELMSFFAYHPVFRGGVNVAAGYVNADRFADIVTGPGIGGGPHVKVFSGADGSTLFSFFAYNQLFARGVFVAAGDVNDDGLDDLFTGLGPGPSEVKVFNAADGSLLVDFLAYPDTPGGARVAKTDLDGDDIAELVTVPGPGTNTLVKVFDALTETELESFFAFDFFGGPPFPGGEFSGGAFLGGG